MTENCLKTNYRANVTEKYFGLFCAVFDICKSLQIQIFPKYVAGHQENKKKILNIYERLNVAFDINNKAFRKLIDKGEIFHRPVGYGDANWNTRIGDLRLSSKFQESIQDHILGTKLVNKMISRNDISRAVAEIIDWNMIGGDLNIKPLGTNYGFLNLSVVLLQRQYK